MFRGGIVRSLQKVERWSSGYLCQKMQALAKPLPLFFSVASPGVHMCVLKQWYYLLVAGKKQCRDPGSNRGPLDLQSNALPTELSRHFYSGKPVPTEESEGKYIRRGGRQVGLPTLKKRGYPRSYRDLNSDRWIQSPEC